MKFHRLALNTFLKILDAFAWKGTSDYKSIVEFTGLSRASVENAITNALALSLLISVDSIAKTYKLIDKFTKNMSLESQNLIVKEHLQHWSFFQQLCYFLDQALPNDEAIRKTLSLCKLPMTSSTSAKNVLLLAFDLDLVKSNGTIFVIPDTLKNKTMEYDSCSLELESEMAATNFLLKRLTPELFMNLEKPEQDRLIKSLLLYSSDPEKSCEYAGQAIENYLRMLGTTLPLDMTSYDGLGQLADVLARKSTLAIHPKHRDFSRTISALRNCTAHNRDKLTNTPWIVTSETAFITVLLTIQLIKSIDTWVKSRTQVI